ncbi:hypothetical protein [Streptomyces sp. XD-27]|uniref:hypothetical protein n=1 Tax=Streptomyces sp. XD-27 TaxID=3062779 RepID=UPI0026F465FB|nr:hypothetical protein [Streptomyces sp. XD-27]WKX69733.1 hypothetical protein Q3Y56_07245 [Streptomyces sp. XD-27]
MTFVNATRALAGGALVAALVGVAAPAAQADPAPVAPEAPAATAVSAARDAATAPATLDTLSRFFTRDGAAAKGDGKAGAKRTAAPRIEGATVPVYILSAAFVAADPAARDALRTPVAELEFLASKAVSSDGQAASVWTVRQGGSWQVVNIATGDDETRYAAKGAKKLKGGTVFREPQIDAWYVQRGDRVLPLDADATRAIGSDGTTVRAYQKRVHTAYGDKLPGSAYAKKGKAGGYGPQPKQEQEQQAAGGSGDGLLTATSTVAGAGAIVALGLCGAAALRTRRRGTL